VSIGVTAGLQRAGIDPSIVWLDGHGDLQTLETTTSGYVGGMALRLLVGYRPELVAEGLALRPPPEARVALVDARDLDPPEVDYLGSSPVRRLTLGEVTVETLPAGPLMVNVDVDIIDPVALAGLRYPAPDGPSIAAVLRAVRTIVSTGRRRSQHRLLLARRSRLPRRRSQASGGRSARPHRDRALARPPDRCP
jgi:arginase